MWDNMAKGGGRHPVVTPYITGESKALDYGCMCKEGVCVCVCEGGGGGEEKVRRIGQNFKAS